MSDDWSTDDWWGNDQEASGEVEEAEIHRMNKPKAWRFLHCRSLGSAFLANFMRLATRDSSAQDNLLL